MKKVILDAKRLTISFGELHAVSDFCLSIYDDELVGLIGPNGAGKTTVFNLITGVYMPDSGTIVVNDKDVTKMLPHERVHYGLARTFQNIRLFKNLSVLDNVKTGFNHTMKYSPIEAILRLPRYKKEEQEIDKKAKEILTIFGLDSLENEYAENLAYGKQRKLEIARALACNPKVLLLDEPAAGMNPTETAELMETIKLVKNQFHVSVLLIEHDMKLVMGICERIIVLDYGKTIAVGTPTEISSNKTVIKAYLGE